MTSPTKKPPPSDADDDDDLDASILTVPIVRTRHRRMVRFVEHAPAPREPARRPARVAQMLALAHRFERAIERGRFENRAALARELAVSRARVTQLLDLTLLAPDIQAAVLELVAVEGREPLTEKDLRSVACIPAWHEQRERWEAMKRGLVSPSGCEVALPSLEAAPARLEALGALTVDLPPRREAPRAVGVTTARRVGQDLCIKRPRAVANVTPVRMTREDRKSL